jgi:predicted RNA-binding Zn-ribbon protein involved in translation (DUF1610 family)
MKNRDPYCSVCQKPVKPIKALVTYCCPTCGATFLASQVESQKPLSEAKQTEAIGGIESTHGA